MARITLKELNGWENPEAIFTDSYLLIPILINEVKRLRKILVEAEECDCPVCGADTRKRYDCKFCSSSNHLGGDCLHKGEHYPNCEIRLIKTEEENEKV